jgi:acylphosphatase
MIRLIAHFSGTVQGVGFRFMTRQIATQYAVAGFVKNLSDGRVEMVVEGEAREVNALLHSIRERMSDFVEGVEENHSPATGEFKGFEIRR